MAQMARRLDSCKGFGDEASEGHDGDGESMSDDDDDAAGGTVVVSAPPLKSSKAKSSSAPPPDRDAGNDDNDPDDVRRRVRQRIDQRMSPVRAAISFMSRDTFEKILRVMLPQGFCQDFELDQYQKMYVGVKFYEHFRRDHIYEPEVELYDLEHEDDEARCVHIFLSTLHALYTKAALIIMTLNNPEDRIPLQKIYREAQAPFPTVAQIKALEELTVDLIRTTHILRMYDDQYIQFHRSRSRRKAPDASATKASSSPCLDSEEDLTGRIDLTDETTGTRSSSSSSSSSSSKSSTSVPEHLRYDAASTQIEEDDEWIGLGPSSECQKYADRLWCLVYNSHNLPLDRQGQTTRAKYYTIRRKKALVFRVPRAYAQITYAIWYANNYKQLIAGHACRWLDASTARAGYVYQEVVEKMLVTRRPSIDVIYRRTANVYAILKTFVERHRLCYDFIIGGDAYSSSSSGDDDDDYSDDDGDDMSDEDL